VTIGVVIDNRHQHLRQVEMGRGLGDGIVAELARAAGIVIQPSLL
jgi:hypothetical protein